MKRDNAIVVINKTRLEALVERFNTRAQAKFYIEHAGGDFADYESEHETFHRSLETVINGIGKRIKYKVIQRSFVPNFLFSESDIVVVVGQDGLVANTAKYANGLPILAVNPDQSRYDGILLPFDTKTFSSGLTKLLQEEATFQNITLAEARTNDGQRLLAFNDLFIGPSSHTSARYHIRFGKKEEDQSSSGIIVSTGAGSTGWLSSLLNMTAGIEKAFTASGKHNRINLSIPWDTDRLAFVVREPFISRHSGASLCAGMIEHGRQLIIESRMPSNGIIFSDGIESDFIQFNSGMKVEIGVAEQKAVLVV
jgi:NAD kinase